MNLLGIGAGIAVLAGLGAGIGIGIATGKAQMLQQDSLRRQKRFVVYSS